MSITHLFQGRFKLIAALSCVALLTACGGGGGSKTFVPSSVAQSSAASSVAPDVTPNAFSFTSVAGAALSASITSTTITISGINSATPISITGGQYAIGGGAPTSAPGTITNGQTVSVTLFTSATTSTTTRAVLTVGGVEGAFSVTTANILGGAVQGAPLNIATVVTTLAGVPSGADGTGTEASFNTPQSITSDGTNLYIADTNNHKIRKIVIATGLVTTLAGSGAEGSSDGIGKAASFNYPEGITSDGTNLYVADTFNNSIRKIVIATGVVTTLAGSGEQGRADGTGTAASFSSPIGIVGDGTYLYVSDSDNQTIRKIVIATGVVTTFAGSGSKGSADGTGAAASFAYPYGISTDGTSLYVADTDNHKIRKIVIATGVVSTLAGSGAAGDSDGARKAARFNGPRGITSDGVNLYVADNNNHKIRKIEIATGEVTTLAGSGAKGSSDGIGKAASFDYLEGITSDGTHLYVADANNNKIRKIVITTGVVTTLAGSTPSRDGTGSTARFNYPVSMTSDGTNLYIADTVNQKIRKIVIATGVVTTLAGSGTEGSTDGTGTAASFNYPAGITTDGNNLYVTDLAAHIIRKIVIATGVVTTLAGSGKRGSADGTGTEASFNNPSGITSDGTNLYVADSFNDSIRKIVIATGVVTTFGIGTVPRFSNPEGVTTDGANLYVADTQSHKIRKIVIATGVTTTLAGSGLEGSADGTGAAARFSYPYGISTDGTSLYVADTDNHKIRKIVIATGAVTTIAGSGLSGSADGIGTAASFSFPYSITTDGFELFVADTFNNTIRRIH